MIYADTNVIIRLIEGDASARAPLEARLFPLRGTGRFILTSQLSPLECRTKPLRVADTSLLGLYESFFASQEVELVPFSLAVIDKATEVRATYNLKTPDALHLARRSYQGRLHS